MLFEIDHVTRYDYSLPVRLGEHLLRFIPPRLAAQRPGDCRLLIDPPPFARAAGVDAWGNRVERVRFAGDTDHLEVAAHLEIETLDLPGGLQQGRAQLPVNYGGERPLLMPCLEALEEPARLQSFLQPLLSRSAGDAHAFLDALNHAVHGFYHRGIRIEGAPRTPAQTLALGEGVCRDLAVLFMAACRQAGLAARFVSGYQHSDGTRAQRYLHAWAEVYLPGHGWLGYDPTHAAMAGSDHVAVAAAPTPEAVTPVEGGYSFSGATVTSTLRTDIRISTRRASA